MARRWVVGTLVAVATFLLVGRFAAATYVDYLWFASLGATELWKIEFENRLLVGAGSSAIAILFILANLYAVRQSVDSIILPRRVGNLEIGEEVPGRYLTQLTIGASVLLGLLASFPRDRWLELASLRYGLPFREIDPFFDYDLGFYVNWLPFEKSLFVWCLVLLIVVLALVFFLYALTPSLKWVKGGGLHVTHYVRRHAGVLCALAILILAWSFRIEMFDSMVHGSGVDGIFTAADRAMLSARTALTVLAMLAAFLLLWAMWTDQVRIALFCVTAVLLGAIGTSTIVPVIVRESNAPGEIVDSEREFAGVRAGRTRRAFATDDVIAAEPGGAFSFASWTEVSAGISVWDPEQFEAAAASKPGGGNNSGSAGYEKPANLGQLMVAVISAPTAVAASPQQAGGAPPASSLVRALSASTAPDGTMRPASAGETASPLRNILITQPAPAFVLTADSLNRIDAPLMESPLSRLAHAWSRQDFRMLFSDLPRPAPRILLHASVRDRLHKLVPFFEQDSVIYPILHADTLYWAVQLYSHSATYPLSRPVAIGARSYQYFLHAATAIVNATTGSVSIYVTDRPDPIAAAWAARLPAVLGHVAAIPSSIAALLPPAIDGARAQAAAYAAFGGRHDSISGGSIADDFGADSVHTVPHHALIHLPGLSPTTAWVEPLLDANNRLDQLVVAVGGAPPQTYRLTVGTASQSWRELHRRLDAIRDSVAGREEGKVVAGPVRAIPIAGRAAFIRTVYSISATSGPAVAAVTVITGDSMVTGRNLAQAARVRTVAGDDVALTPAAFRARVEALYESMRVAFRKGDLVAFAEAFNALGALLAGAPR